MDFTSDSETIMTFLMKKFKTFSKKRTPREQYRFDGFLNKFYDNIHKAANLSDIAWKSKDIMRTIQEVHSQNNNDDSLLNSVYVPEGIKRFIRTNIKGIVTYKCKVFDREITILINLVNNKQFNELGKIDTLVMKMFTWLYFVIPYTNKKCSEKLKISCYLCPHKKQLPKTQFTVLGPTHVNGGVAGACPLNGEICIYRKEEIFKVFIHETFHAFGLDWSNMQSHHLREKLKKLFPISSNMDVSETYTEFWANIFNCLFTAYFIRDEREDRESFLLFAEYCIYFEQMFSLFQCVKILQFMGIYYKTLYETDELSVKARKFLYKERSNIFAYYILKMVLIMNIDNFLSWCMSNNANIINFTKTDSNLNLFYDFIKNHYNTPRLLNSIEKMYNVTKDNKKNNHNIINKTLRMTVIEIA